MSPQRTHWLILALIFFAGFALRFYRLGDLPPGLYQDEAYNGLDALHVLDGARPIFFTANNGREPFYIYLVAASTGILGRSPLAVRLPAALVGTGLILAAYALGRVLYSPRLGLLAAAVIALTFWPVALSRIGLRAGSLPLFLALSLACAVLGFRRGPRGWPLLALAGALYGFTFYTYLAARFVPLALFAFLVFWYSAQRQTFPAVRQMAAFLVPAVLVVVPLLVAGLRQPEILLGRAGQVSVLNPAVNHGDLASTVLRQTAAALAMFTWRGDGIARHNLPGRPVFDVFLGMAFLAGTVRLGRALVQKRNLAAALLLSWSGVLLLPTILAEDAPHFLRAVGVLPAVGLIAAAGFDWLWAAKFPYAPLRRGLVVAAIVLGGLWTLRDYFGRYVSMPETGYLFQAAATDLSEAITTETVAGHAVYADQRFWDSFASVRFLAGAAPGVVWFSAPDQVAPAARPETVLFVWPYEPVEPVLARLPVGHLLQAEAGPLYRGDLEPAAYSLYSVYRARLPVPPMEPAEPVARFEAGLSLLAYTFLPEAGRLELIWQAAQAPGQDYQVFAQATHGATLLAQADGPLGTALFPSHLWRAGELVGETRLFGPAPAAGWAGATLNIGLYNLASGARLQRVDQPGDAFVITVDDRR